MEKVNVTLFEQVKSNVTSFLKKKENCAYSFCNGILIFELYCGEGDDYSIWEYLLDIWLDPDGEVALRTQTRSEDKNVEYGPYTSYKLKDCPEEMLYWIDAAVKELK